MFERNFTKTISNDRNIQEALFVKDEKQNQRNKINKKRSKKNDICNYCKKKGHWVVDCKKWIFDGKPSKNKEEKVSQSNNTVTLALTSICNV